MHEEKRMSNGFGRINDLAFKVFKTAKDHGFHEFEPRFGEPGRNTEYILSKLMLITTEVAEAAEAARKGDKQNFAEELADIIIRTLDLAEMFTINIEQEIVNKADNNEAREHRHGGKLA